jgi:nicotinate phosphoribosyltransferase
MVDVSLKSADSLTDKAGVNPALVRNVRQALDDAGFRRVRIVVSGGFDVEKIASFESEQVPTDAYGVGSAFMRGSFDFTADVVKLDGAPMSKTGRQFRDNERLVPRALMTS